MDVDETIEERLDHAYAKFGATAPTYGGGLANHGPMAAEAVVAMGGQRHLEKFVASYLPKLDVRPEPSHPILDGPAELGATREFADWSVYFRAEIAAASWTEIARQWLPDLVPGLATAAGHGLLRVAHVLRALGRYDSIARRDELADALAYWCAAFAVLPGADASGTATIDDALAMVPRLPIDVDRAGSITRVLRRVVSLDGWTEATACLAPCPPDEMLRQVALASANAYLQFTPDAFTFIHGVTVPTMAGVLLDYLHESDQQVLANAAWHFVAAAVGGFAPAEGPLDAAGPQSGPPAGRAGMVDMACGTRDDHTIKFVDCAIALATRLGDRVPLLAADDRIVRTS